MQYRFVPTSLTLNGVPLASRGPLRVYDVDFSVTDAAFQSGRASASAICLASSISCADSTGILASVPFFETRIDVTFRPDGLLDGSVVGNRTSDQYSLTGTGLQWSGLYASDAPFFLAAAPDQSVQCAGGLGSGTGCTVTGYFLAAPLTTPGQGIPVPEPASAALLAVGLLTLARRRR